MMIQKFFIEKIKSLYEGDNFTAILPTNLKKCRQKHMTNQLPKIVKEKQLLNEYLQKASYIVRKNMKEKEFDIDPDSPMSENSDSDFLPPPTIKKRSSQIYDIDEEFKENMRTPPKRTKKKLRRLKKNKMEVERKPQQDENHISKG